MKRLTLLTLIVTFAAVCFGQQPIRKTIFSRDFSPAEGLVTPHERPYRDEICLNGLWEVQCIALPRSWHGGSGEAPELPDPQPDKWDTTKIKIPSPINVNNWGQGYNVGEGTRHPYAPSSVYFPSYPEHWIHARMAWLHRTFTIPQEWNNKRIVLHFEAVAGESRIVINGEEVYRNFESHLPFDVDITNYINRNGENEIKVGLRHTRLFDKSHPDYKYMGATYPTGSNTDDLIGIWQDVMLWAEPEVRIKDVFVQPWVDRGELLVELTVENTTQKRQQAEIGGDIREWINLTGKDVISAAEISWKLGESALTIPKQKLSLKAGESRRITLTQKVDGELKYWSPDEPNLYTLLLTLNNKRTTIDCKAERFGWRQFKIVGEDFHLNGKPIQCFGDIQHPFSAYICSRRFAYAWYQMIKDFGGNAVRPHAQPWPRVYYDLADEMGLMVLDETGVFGSSIRMNFEEEITWERSKEHLRRLILRDRNHPSVVGWSAGNETFAIALLNKPPIEVAAKWDDKLVEITLTALKHDPTRDFITLDGDRDMDGRLPVWSKHFGHNLEIFNLPKDAKKPLIVGESGATYYGRPIQLYPFAGERAFECYEGRNEALAIDVFQNARYMAQPLLDYYSPSEVCWFGLEHLPLGYNDFNRLPTREDGIFAGKPYEEGKFGYQYERIPPYVTTFNPGLDPALPLYKSLAMFKALQAALKGGSWQPYKQIKHPAKPEWQEPIYNEAYFVGKPQGKLSDFIARMGIATTDNANEAELYIVDMESVSAEELNTLNRSLANNSDAMVWAFGKGELISDNFNKWLPAPISLTSRKATALECNKGNAWGAYFELPDLYFAESEGDRVILKAGLEGELIKSGEMVFTASQTDWSLFNNVAEHWKCAQVVLYEALNKPAGTAMVKSKIGGNDLVISALDYTITSKESQHFWESLLKAMRIKADPEAAKRAAKAKEHNLLMDGPVD